MIVMKFGGTSLGSGQRILEVAGIVAAEQQHQPVVVVSAMSQVTNKLIELAEAAIAQNGQTRLTAGLEHLRQLHQAAARALQLTKGAEQDLLTVLETHFTSLEAVLLSTAALEELTPRGHDLIVSFGEQLSAHLVAAALQQSGLAATAVAASELIVTDDNFGSASPLFEPSCQRMRPRLQPLLDNHIIPVITGFTGATKDGVVTTLGRGGSDYSATIIGHCLRADEVWICTDVDGVMTADPRLVPDAHPIDRLSYDEAAELSYFGAKVLHPRTMVAAALNNTPIFIKNTFRPEAAGTKISQAAYQHPKGVKAITVLHDLSLITIQGKGMQGVPGIAAKVFTALAEENINVLFISQASSENNISLVTNKQDGDRAAQALRATFEPELTNKNLETVQAESDLSMIAVVGDGLRSRISIAGRIFTALGHSQINVIAIAQGSSERNLSFVVNRDQATQALQSIHDELELAKNHEVQPEPESAKETRS